MSDGNDTFDFIEGVVGGFGDDTLTGDGNANLLDGSSGNDTLSGVNGDDTLIGGFGSDTVDGGAGNDTASFLVGTSTSVSIDLTAGTASSAGIVDVLIGIEHVIGAAFGDLVTMRRS